MAGSQPYSIVPTRKFESSLKPLIKRYKGSKDKQVFQTFVAQIVNDLCSEPRPSNSSPEPLPGKISLPEGLEFRKMRFAIMPRLSGAAGQGRLMYLVNPIQRTIALVWIYTHEEFEGRPDATSLNATLRDAISFFPDGTDTSTNSGE
jgi:hypothetical protein